MVSDNRYKTSDTALAAYLITAGFPLLSIDYSQPRFEWYFIKSEQIQEAADNYLTGNALIGPSDYARIFKKLNRIIGKRCQWEED